MTDPTTTRRPTAKQREFLLAALTGGSLSASMAGYQQRTTDAMIADGWIVELSPNIGAITLQGAVAVGKRIEFSNEQDRIAAATPTSAQATITGWKYAKLGTAPAAYTGPAADFTHTCDSCGRRFVGEFDTWNDRCGFCTHKTHNGMPAHLGGIRPGTVVHASQPETVTSRCAYDPIARAFQYDAWEIGENACITTATDAVTCPLCKVLNAWAAGRLTGAAFHAELTRVGANPAPLPVDEPVDVDPAPGTVDNLLGLVDLCVGELVQAAFTNGDEQAAHNALALQHREQIETIARNLLAEPVTDVEAERAGARAVDYPDAGQHNAWLSGAMTALERVAATGVVGGAQLTNARKGIAGIVAMVARSAFEHGRQSAGPVDIIARRSGHPDQILALTPRHWQHAAAVDGAPLSLMLAAGYDGYVDPQPGANPDDELPALRPVEVVELPEHDVAPSSLSAAFVEAVGADPLVDVGDRCVEHGKPGHDHDGEYVGPGGTYRIGAEVEPPSGEWPTDPAARAREEEATAAAFPVGRRVSWQEGRIGYVGEVKTIYPGGRGLWVVDDNGFGHTVAPSAATLEDVVDKQLVALNEILSTQPDGVDGEQVFVYTFGANHEDPVTGESLNNCYTVVVADDRAAGDRDMFARYGDEWSFGYDLNAGVDMIVRFPEMRQVRIADLLPPVAVERLGLGVNGYTLRGQNGATLVRASWSGGTDRVRLDSDVPGLHFDGESIDAELADGLVSFRLQQWLRGVFGLRVRVVIDDAGR
jgi:hypothetical protein